MTDVRRCIFSNIGQGRVVKKAFTLIELVLVIAIVGILSVVLAPNFQRDNLTEAANQLISHIRYTQHLAMMDNKYNATDNDWYKNRWQLRFSKSVSGEDVWSYTIFSDNNHDYNPNKTTDTIAKNPLNSKQLLSGGFSGTILLTDKSRMKELALGQKYGVKWVSFSRSCSTGNPNTTNQSRKIIFDSLGRPYWKYLDTAHEVAPYNAYKNVELVKDECVISLCSEIKCVGGEVVQIGIAPETGYSHIL